MDNMYFKPPVRSYLGKLTSQKRIKFFQFTNRFLLTANEFRSWSRITKYVSNTKPIQNSNFVFSMNTFFQFIKVLEFQCFQIMILQVCDVIIRKMQKYKTTNTNVFFLNWLMSFGILYVCYCMLNRCYIIIYIVSYFGFFLRGSLKKSMLSFQRSCPNKVTDIWVRTCKRIRNTLNVLSPMVRLISESTFALRYSPIVYKWTVKEGNKKIVIKRSINVDYFNASYNLKYLRGILRSNKCYHLNEDLMYFFCP